ncbi:ankyrin repeat domain-containing protein 50 [Cladorrhinum sp. PSN332]|nr:ankyrin repeat domain-containing protein 50 [Cladorrhinum sp. PSN332]
MAGALDDFSNNLATDVAPLIALFGERITIQYFSESTSFIDYLIFALAPVGIVTAITAAIRVAGDGSLKAMIGRAQEGDGKVEAELCTSTSRDVCEVFHRGGITRVFGTPKILELIRLCGPEERNKKESGHYTMGVYLFRDYLRRNEKNPKAVWVLRDRKGWKNTIPGRSGPANPIASEGNLEEGQGQPVTELGQGPTTDTEFLSGESDPSKTIEGTLDTSTVQNPNISINIGIVQPPEWMLQLVAVLGLFLQGGVIAMAAVISWRLQWNTEGPPDTLVGRTNAISANRSAMAFVLGTFCLCIGMLACAALIGESTDERRYRRNDESPSTAAEHTSQLLWLQPGNQMVGDETFDVFAYIEGDGKKGNRVLWEYTTSSKAQVGFHRHTWAAALLSLAGYIAQFIGLRGMHASVSMAQLGITLLMSLVRACLRLRRLRPDDNKLGHVRDSVLGFELDWLATELELPKRQRVGELATWHIINEPSSGVSEQSLEPSLGPGQMILNYRTRLAHLTGHFPPTLAQSHSFQPWKDEQVCTRMMARNLGSALSTTAACLFGHETPQRSLTIKLYARLKTLKKVSQSPNSPLGLVPEMIEVEIEPLSGGSEIGWTTDSSKLESILSLWAWGIKQDDRFHESVLRSEMSLGDIRKSVTIERARVLSSSSRASVTDELKTVENELELWMGKATVKPIIGALHRLPGETGAVTWDVSVIWRTKQGTNGAQNFNSHWPVMGPKPQAVWGAIGPRNGAKFKRFFGWQTVQPSDNLSILYVNSQNDLLVDCCQELYATILSSLVTQSSCDFDSVTVKGDAGQVELEDPKISAIIEAFTSNGLGSRSDAILCIMPVLRHKLKISSPHSLESALTRMLRDNGSAAALETFTRGLIALLEYGRRALAYDSTPEAREDAYQMIRRVIVKYNQIDGQGEGVKIILNRYGLVATQRSLDFGESFEAEGIAFAGFDLVPLPEDLITVISEGKRGKAVYLLCTVTQHLLETELEAALPVAAEKGWDEIVRGLLHLGGFVDAQSLDGRTALSYYCAKRGSASMVQSLLDAGSLPDLPDVQNRTPLWWAAGTGDRDVVQLLRNTGKVNLDVTDDQGVSALCHAAELGRREIFRLLRDTGLVNMDLPDKRGRTPLSYSAENGHISILRDLIILFKKDRRVNPNSVDSQGRTPLSWAAGSGHASVVKALLDLPTAEPLSQDEHGKTPLRWAVESDHIKVAEQLLALYEPELDADVNGLTPLHSAAQKGHKDLIKMLAKRFPGSIASTDAMGRTPLWWCVRCGHADTAELLLNLQPEGLGVDQKDISGRTALWWAARNGDTTAVDFLIKRGANPRAFDMSFHTPLWSAVRYGHWPSARLLINTGNAHPAARGTGGQTPLMCAARHGDTETVQCLLQVLTPADVNARDDEGRTAHAWALKAGNSSIEQLLRTTVGSVGENHW